MRKYIILTYGCQMNESDSLRMGSELHKLGYEPTTELAEAQVILINTCSVRESAENKIYGKIGEVKHLKAANPELIFGVTGCMAQKEGEKLLKRAPHIDFVLGTNKIHELADIILELSNHPQHIVALAPADGGEPEEVAPPSLENAKSVWLPIMYGCNNFCTYCIVPYVRGREHSRKEADILAEAAAYAKQGVKEITLLGQNVNSYGKNLSGTSFPELLAKLDAISGLERVRYMTSHPRDFSDELISVIAQSKHICSHFHLPLQHASNKLLRKMNRGYTLERYLELVKKVRQAVPEAVITTDLIVGFPGETEEDQAVMLDALREIRYDAAYTFIYSPRSGTPAATMEEQVPQEVKKARLQALMDVQNDISLEKNQAYVGKTVRVMVEGPSKNNPEIYTGRTDGNKLVLWPYRGQEQVGDFLPVKIEKAQTWLLKGIIDDEGK